jgi:hypothetical protein
VGRWWPWLPLLAAAVYAVSLVANFHSVTQSVYLAADRASAPYIGELYPHAGHGAQVVLGRFPWYTTFWIESLTRWLPAHRVWWEVGPWIGSLLGVALVAWSTARAAGRWAAGVVAVVLACASPGTAGGEGGRLLTWQFSASQHALTFAHVAVLGAFLVFLVTRGGRVAQRSIAHWAACAGVAAITAAGLASDALLGAAGVAPFLLAGIATAALVGGPVGRRVAASTVAIPAAAVVGARLVGHVMRTAGVIPHPGFSVSVAPPHDWGTSARQLGESVLHLFNAHFGGSTFSAEAVLQTASALVVIAAAVAALAIAARWIAGARRAASAAAETAHLAFWIAAGVLLAVVIVTTNLAGKHDSSKYLVTLGYAIVAVLAVAAARRGWAKACLVAGACVLVAGSVSVLWSAALEARADRSPLVRASGPLLRLARDQHLDHGYARYADAAVLGWRTRARVRVYPIASCHPGAPTLCPWGFHRISSWYRPRRAARTFVVTDALTRKAMRSLGKPTASFHAAGLAIYVYPYDVASKLGHCSPAGERHRCPS